MLTIPTSSKIKEYFPQFRICIVRVFCALLYCIIEKGTVNLNTCKKSFGKAVNQKNIKLETAYKRLIRFFNMKCAVNLGSQYD